MPHALELTGVSKIYEVGGVELLALDGVDLAVADEEVVTLLGPSGSGKTTLLSIAGGLLSASSGHVIVGGQDITRAYPRELTAFRRERVGFIFQAVNLVPFLTARENLLVVAELARRDRGEARRRADRLLEELGLGHRTDNLPSQLSGGERQRVAIGRALMNQPALVLVDEPTSALDSDLGQQVMQLIVSEVKARGAAAVIVTHDSRMTRYGDRIFNMADGRIAGMTPRPEWTLNRPDDVLPPALEPASAPPPAAPASQPARLVAQQPAARRAPEPGGMPPPLPDRRPWRRQQDDPAGPPSWRTGEHPAAGPRTGEVPAVDPGSGQQPAVGSGRSPSWRTGERPAVRPRTGEVPAVDPEPAPPPVVRPRTGGQPPVGPRVPPRREPPRTGEPLSPGSVRMWGTGEEPIVGPRTGEQPPARPAPPPPGGPPSGEWPAARRDPRRPADSMPLWRTGERPAVGPRTGERPAVPPGRPPRQPPAEPPRRIGQQPPPRRRPPPGADQAPPPPRRRPPPTPPGPQQGRPPAQVRRPAAGPPPPGRVPPSPPPQQPRRRRQPGPQPKRRSDRPLWPDSWWGRGRRDDDEA